MTISMFRIYSLFFILYSFVVTLYTFLTITNTFLTITITNTNTNTKHYCLEHSVNSKANSSLRYAILFNLATFLVSTISM